MKAFITGGTGFIGSHLVDRLLRDGSHELRCMVRSKEKWLAGKQYTKVEADLNDIPEISKAVDGVDVIFHTAGVVKAADTCTFTMVNVEATENLLRIAMKHSIPKIVILSSQAAAGPSFDRAVDESMPMMPVSRYGESKKKMEEMIHEVADKGISVSIIRPSSVYGPREEDIYTMFKIAAKGFFPIVGKGSGKPISMAHVDDIVEGTLLAEKDRREGVETFFISSERGYSWHEISDATSAALGKKLMRINVPESAVKNVGTIAQTAASFFGKYPVMNEDKAREMVLSWVCSIEKAQKELKFEPKVSLEDGIRDTILWYKKHQWL
ncbi:MAG: NAD(P)-dependent oxidoreductase [Balneolales bacterium]|nr:NAD(P)-dependent oxidoreductase [Balneolales bacterium]